MQKHGPIHIGDYSPTQFVVDAAEGGGSCIEQPAWNYFHAGSIRCMVGHSDGWEGGSQLQLFIVEDERTPCESDQYKSIQPISAQLCDVVVDEQTPCE
jgi:hypothetical protein